MRRDKKIKFNTKKETCFFPFTI